MDGRQGPLASSLRFRLSLWISIAILAGAAAAGWYSYSEATDDAHREQDTQLQQIGYLLSRIEAAPASPMARERVGNVDFEARIVVRFLADAGGRPLKGPDRAPYFPKGLKDGMQTVTLGLEEWRVFVRTGETGIRVAVAQQTVVRDAAARAGAIRAVTPILILGPLLVLMVALLVRAMFQPLRTLTAQLEGRQGHELVELDRSPLPSEVWPFVTAINQLIARTVRTMALQRRFIADAAHELRSPMTAMSLQAERLAASRMPDEARERLGALSAGLGRTRVLLDQLLTLARTQESSNDGATAVSLKNAIHDCLEDLVPLAEAKRIDLGVIGDADPLILGQAVDVGVLVKNLIDNAIRYTPEGGRVDVRVAQDAGRVHLHVIDTGPGIPESERERVFDPFYRVLGNGQIGSGLGLAITRTIADQIGATITLDTPAGEAGGLSVNVAFPAARA